MEHAETVDCCVIVNWTMKGHMWTISVAVSQAKTLELFGCGGMMNLSEAERQRVREILLLGAIVPGTTLVTELPSEYHRYYSYYDEIMHHANRCGEPHRCGQRNPRIPEGTRYGNCDRPQGHGGLHLDIRSNPTEPAIVYDAWFDNEGGGL